MTTSLRPTGAQSALFTPLALRGEELPNRICISPMCQYSAADGNAQPWHTQHVGALALSGAALVTLEATAVSAEGRITPGDLGLYSDANEAALTKLIADIRTFSPTPIGVQLAHAGRKASAQRPWEGGHPLSPDQGAWTTVAPSPIPQGEGWPVPEPLDAAGIKRLVGAWETAARRAARIGLASIELHGAHGYLIHEFCSPLANRRSDSYGGSRENRFRFALEIAEAVRRVWPDRILGYRITGTDWLEGGLTVADAVALAGALKDIGIDYVCVSSGGIGRPKIPTAPGYQVPFAAEVRRATGIVTQAVGLIVDPYQAEEIVASGAADLIALARAVLDDPRWGWHAAEALDADIPYPAQYDRAAPGSWPGYWLAHAHADQHDAIRIAKRD